MSDDRRALTRLIWGMWGMPIIELAPVNQGRDQPSPPDPARPTAPPRISAVRHRRGDRSASAGASAAKRLAGGA
jgi:hypothetical protein